MNKGKIINDPIYGLLHFSEPEIMLVINHPWFQRLRHIKQMGLSNLVYPGAEHTRFGHSLGACHLMGVALTELRLKGFSINDEEFLAARLAILLHDVGHGPFSHCLEHQIVSGVHHETISRFIITRLIDELSLPQATLSIFEGTYHKKFLHQLVSSQLDVDRMDYLTRDSFFSGVSEGVIGYDRILKMLQVVDDQIVVEEKAIHSIEKFLIARRLMYQQVYLHKTVLGAEQLLIKIIERAKECLANDQLKFCTPYLSYFFNRNWSENEFFSDSKHLELFCHLDDNEIWVCVKSWMNEQDSILRNLCTMLVQRKLYKVILGEDLSTYKDEMKSKALSHKNFTDQEVDWYIFKGKISTSTYNVDKGEIFLLEKTGQINKLSSNTNSLFHHSFLGHIEKEFLCMTPEIKKLVESL